MKIFISWSGDRSKYIATALRDWLRNVIQAADPWMSDVDIGTGKPWFQEISVQLAECKAGIICVMPENQDKPWPRWVRPARPPPSRQVFPPPIRTAFGRAPASARR